MNFYIGNSIKTIKMSDFNVEVDDELIDFVYKLKDKSTLDMSKLYKVDPYSDHEIPNKDVLVIAEICAYLLESPLLKKYDEYDQGRQMLEKLLKIAESAINKGKGLISIGD